MITKLVYFEHLLKEHRNLGILNLEVGVLGVSGSSEVVRKIIFL